MMKTLTIHFGNNVPNDLEGLILPENIAAQLCTYLATWKAVNVTLIAVPILPLLECLRETLTGSPPCKRHPKD
jgi:hypothetical protein